MSATRTILRTAIAFGLSALVAGGLHAWSEIGGRTWVLEFQAGPASAALEKAGASQPRTENHNNQLQTII